ncbi:MAG: copper chaperone PCu(A)C [Azoarcus sp.]|nr:copper chaperone PCu(A)C [Azoarcus sp.]
MRPSVRFLRFVSHLAVRTACLSGRSACRGFRGDKTVKKFCIASLLAILSAPVLADVQVDEPWVRATVAQQKASGAFMTLTASKDARLVEAASPVAGVVEIHEMKMENQIMRMRRVEAVELPAGEPVTLAPGGHHVMLLELGAPLSEGDEVALTLTVEYADGTRETIDVTAPVRPLTHRSPGGQHHRH